MLNSRTTISILIVMSAFAGIFLFFHFFRETGSVTALPNTYRIAYDDSWYPLRLYDKESNVSLFSEELVKAIANLEKFSVEFIQIRSDELLAGLEKGDYDGILSSSILYGEETEKYISSIPYYYLGPVLVSSTSSSIKSLNDLNGKRIGVIIGSDSILVLSKYTSTDFVSYGYIDRFKMLDDVINNVLDGMVVDMMTAYEYKNSGLFRSELRIDSLPLGNKGLRLILMNNKENKIVIRRFNEGLKTIENSGLYSQLLSKWGLFNPEKLRDQQVSGKQRTKQ